MAKGESKLLRSTEALIAELFGYGDAVLFGRARSGLVALLETLRGRNPLPFIMPSNICSSVFAAAKAARADPILADVSGKTGLPTDQTLVECLEKAPMAGAVMLTNLYGFAHRYPLACALARERDWFILENDASAAKAIPAKPAPDAAMGDALLVSFGAGKVIDGGAGGAVLTNDADLADGLRVRREAYQPLDDDAEKAETQLMMLRRLLRQGLRKGQSLTAHYEAFLPYETAETCYQLPPSFCPAIKRAIAAFPEERTKRCESWDQWSHALSKIGDGIVLPDHTPETPWRFVARIPQDRDRIVAALREAGIDAGTNYPPLHDFFPDTIKGQAGLGARAWGDEVINLWISDGYDKARMEMTAGIISSTLAEDH